MAKYKIGQKVIFNQDPARGTYLLITEIQEITCSAGTQVFYTGRLWMDWMESSRYSAPAGSKACHRDLWKANEIELTAFKEEKAKKTKKK
jgi:hypothetical protein